jgi:hypothetical protein
MKPDISTLLKTGHFYFALTTLDLIIDIPPEKEYKGIEGRHAKWWFCSSRPALQVGTEGR